MKIEFQQLEDSVKEVCDQRPVYYMPNPGNWGDALIRSGTHKFFHDIGLCYTEIDAQTDIQAKVNHAEESVLIYGGGGGWCRLWGHSPYFLKQLLPHFHHTIVLPSTYEVVATLTDTTFFCRDRYHSQSNLPAAIFCHDMAFCLEPHADPATEETGYFFRTDAESAKRYPIPSENRDVSFEGNHLLGVAPFFAAIAKFAVIHTDRLHVAIAACLLGRDLHFYPGSYFKNWAVFTSSIRPYFDNVCFHHDLSEHKYFHGNGQLTQTLADAGPAHHSAAPKISVILSACAAESDMIGAIESIRAQTLKEWELIIVDEDANQQTWQYINSYGKQDRRIRIETVSTRRRGFELAQGEFIYGLDSQHWSHPEALQRLYEHLTTDTQSSAAFGIPSYVSDAENDSANPFILFSQVSIDHFLQAGIIAFRRSVLKELLAQPEISLDDHSIWWWLSASGSLIFVSGAPLSSRQNAGVKATSLSYPTQEPSALCHKDLGHARQILCYQQNHSSGTA
ncbi:glycosyltransferase [Chloroflexi bacterium TSY]|nr:glycosyltransferase [Chloroflexi bacterium TSY]